MVNASVVPKTSIAVIGGGIAGLSCANRLLQIDPSLDVTVFNPGGKYAIGGRCSPQHLNYKRNPIISKSLYDHAVQMLTLPPASDDRFSPFRQQLKDWERDKVISEFPNDSIYSINPDGDVKRKQIKAFYGTKGFGHIPKLMSQNIPKLLNDVRVSPNDGVRRKNDKWIVSSKGEKYGSFDRIVIAHRGESAHHLMSDWAGRVYRLLKVIFSPYVPAGGKHLTLNSLYSVTFALSAIDSPLSERLPPTFICGEMQGPDLRFLTRQTKKYPRNDDVEIRTVLSLAKFHRTDKLPEEVLPLDIVTMYQLRALMGTFGISALDPLESRIQRWAEAIPLNTWQNGKGFIYDSSLAVGVCGDWLMEPSIAGAWTSGYLLADHMMESKSPSTVGLEGKFVKCLAAEQSGLSVFPEQVSADLSMQT